MAVNDEWIRALQAARAPIEAWIGNVAPAAWLAPREGPWTRKDLLGHLTAWSDFLLDQVEALGRNRADTIEAVDVNRWNAVEVDRRRSWTVEAVLAEWRQSVRRTDDVVTALPPDVWVMRWRVAWAAEPVAIEDVLRLMVVHIGQHRLELAKDT